MINTITLNNNYMVTMNISINDELATIVDKEMKEKKYANRSEFFRDLIRKQYLQKKALIPSNLEYYKTLDQTFQDWADPANDDLFLTE